MFDKIKYQEIKEKIQKTSISTEIIAISKYHSRESVNQAISCGVRIFGENRVLEAKNKFEDILSNNKEVKLHLTGPLQTNKVKQALKIFHVLHTIDREKLVNELCKFPDQISKKKLFVQVNTGKEKNKSGVYPENLKNFLNFCKDKKVINIAGLMCIPPINENAFHHFKNLKQLAEENNLSELSIGMSADYEEALPFKPSYIRLGSILFGERD